METMSLDLLNLNQYNLRTTFDSLGHFAAGTYQAEISFIRFDHWVGRPRSVCEE